MVSSVVSSSLLARIAEAHGARHAETLTGFKWLSRPAMEHPGVDAGARLRGGHRLRDRPRGARQGRALGRAWRWRRWPRRRARGGRTLLDELDDLHRRHGAHVTDNFSLRDEAPGGAARRAALVERLVAAPPARVGAERGDRRAQPGARRAAHRPRRRGPGDRAAERHRAQAQVLLRGGRAGGGRGRRGRARGAGAGAPRATSARAWRPCSSPDARPRRVPRSADAHPRP